MVIAVRASKGFGVGYFVVLAAKAATAVSDAVASVCEVLVAAALCVAASRACSARVAAASVRLTMASGISCSISVAERLMIRVNSFANCFSSSDQFMCAWHKAYMLSRKN